MPIMDGYDQGRFEGQVIERLDALKVMGEKVDRCLEEHHKRLTVLEGQAIKLKAFCAAIAIVFGYFGHKLTAIFRGLSG